MTTTRGTQRSSAAAHRHFSSSSVFAAMASLLAAAGGLWLAGHYPLSATVMAALFLAVTVAVFLRPGTWLVLVPAALPLIGLAPWTGWLSVEELDILVLAVAAGGYAHLARTGARAGGRVNALVVCTIALFVASTLVAMVRGVTDAGGFVPGWYQGYHEPMNSLRLAKPLLLALLLWPLWRSANGHAPEQANERLLLGLLLGLAGVALTTVWERLAYTGLLNFSSDYRTTGLFWEMHVGGAALDGILAMSVPFALYALLATHKRSIWIAAAAAAALGGYSCLTTFSRGVYLAVPIGVALTLVLHALQQRRTAPRDSVTPGLAATLVPAALLALCFTLAAAFLFRSSGYRGMLALLGATVLLLALPTLLPRLGLAEWIKALVLGSVGAGLVALAALLLPKGAYLAYMAAFAATAALWLRSARAEDRRGSQRRLGWVVLAGYIAVVSGVVAVAQHWGGESAWIDALPAAAALLVGAGLASRRSKPAWPTTWRWQGMVVGLLATIAGVVGIFGGGVYMSERFSTGSKDLGGRLAHWQLGLNTFASAADWALGKGLGRFPSTLYFADTPDHPGDYRLVQEERNGYLSISAGKHVMGWGEILRVSQRVAVPALPLVVTANVRAATEVRLHFEVCEKHLLYNDACVFQQVSVKPLPGGAWQPVRADLQGQPVGRGSWYAPKFLMFSLALGTRDARAEIDNVALTDSQGRQLLANGDFSDGMARWFFSSDRHHMPWHIKSVLMNVLFDQGIVGLTLWLLLGAGALWRLSKGHARNHALAAPLAGALVGFLVVGLFDSLLDVPRLAFLFYFLLLLALTLQLPRQRSVPTPQPTALAANRRAPGLALWAGVGILLALSSSDTRADATARTPERTLQVGPARALRTLAEAARVARAGDTIAVDAGEYFGDVAVWTQDRLTLRAVGGRVRLVASGAAAEGKGIWVIRAQGVTVEGFDFEGASVPSRNGAGIRFDKGSLRVRDCTFRFNEMGLLTGNDADSVLEVENSEFAHNARPDGHNHNLYVGQIARLSVQGSYLHHARTGHLLKTRAAVNYVAYNRLTDEAGGTASYELEFPNGGTAYVIGNIIEQGAQTENPHLVSFGAEGYTWPANALHLVHNTLVDGKAQGGVFVRVAPGTVTVQALNNLFVGPGQRGLPETARQAGNVTLSLDALGPATSAGSYQLREGTVAPGTIVDPGSANGQDLRLVREYVHPRGSQPLRASAHNPGAVQRTRRPPA